MVALAHHKNVIGSSSLDCCAPAMEFYEACSHISICRGCLVGHLFSSALAMDQRTILAVYAWVASIMCKLRSRKHLYAEVFEFPHNYISSLDKLGFEFAGLLAQDSAQIRPKLRIAMYVHPVNRDSAQAARMESRRGIIYVLVFKTRFNDGFAFETSNNFTARIFPQNQEFPVFRFPMMRSELDLYRIHQALKERFSATRSPIVGGGVEELNEFVAQAEAAHRRNASLDYKLSEAGDRYVFTLRGAIRCAWC